MFTRAFVSRGQSAVCITLEIIPYEIRTLYVGLDEKGMSESFIEKVRGSESKTVDFWGLTSQNFVFDWTLEKRKDSRWCCNFSLRVVTPLEIGFPYSGWSRQSQWYILQVVETSWFIASTRLSNFSALVFFGREKGCLSPGKRVVCDQMRKNVVAFLRQNVCSAGWIGGFNIPVDGFQFSSKFFWFELFPVV